MKKVLFLTLCNLMPVLAFCQYYGKKVELGFTASPNIAWFSVNNSNVVVSNEGIRPGFSYGVLGDFELAPNYYFGTAFTFTSINGKVKYPGSVSDATRTDDYRLKYLEVPVTLKLKSKASELGRFYGQFGFGTAMRVGTKGSSEEKRLGQAPTEIQPTHLDHLNRFRLSVIVGAGAEWNVNNDFRVLTGLTYNNAFTKTTGFSGDLKSSYLAFTFGVFF